MSFPILAIFPLYLASAVAIAAPPVVAVDVGHSLADSGAVSARGRAEFEFNRDFAAVLAEALRAHGLAVREINFAGDARSLAERPARAAGSDFFISIHHDSIARRFLDFWDWQGTRQSYTTVKRGYGLFVSSLNPDLQDSLLCASSIGAVLRRAGFEPSAWHARRHAPADRQNGVWYYDNLYVVHHATQPAVLLEAGVIKNREEELLLRDPARQRRMADAVATGIAACLYVRGAGPADGAAPR